MWVVIRLIAALIGFGARLLHRWFPRKPTGLVDDMPYFLDQYQDKQDWERVVRIGVPLQTPVIFRLQAEGFWDRVFKAIGIAEEVQIGDNEFDRTVYVACDHPALAEFPEHTPGTRTAIRKVLDHGFRRISADGEVLWIEWNAERGEPGKRALKMLVNLRDTLAGVGQHVRNRSDPFLARFVAIEAVTWSLFGYAIGAFVEWTIRIEDYHPDRSRLVGLGFVAAGALFSALFALIVVLLRGSSRGHRILVESALLLMLGLPIAGIQAISDLNRQLDDTEPIVVSRQVEGRSRQYSHRRTSYYLYLAPAVGTQAVSVPSRVKVTRRLYNQAATTGSDVVFSLGRGWLGVPWYRQIVIKER